MNEQKEKVYFDTFVFMDILSDNPDIAKKAEAYLRNNNGVVSSILLSELAFHIKRKKGKERMEEILFYIQSLPNLEIIPVDAEIAILAGKLRSRYYKKIEKYLTYFDCIHIATAIVTNCKKFITGDKGFRNIREIEIEIY
ncbi:MAG: PIN domain-containing protein [Candidatus Aenigmatarchaeota archaeon]